MAEVVDSMPPKTYGRYPWDQWLDGQMWKLTRSDDYEGEESLFVASARAAAKRRDKSVNTSVNRKAGVVYLQAVSATSPERQPGVTK